jgi:hypothetical protein
MSAEIQLKNADFLAANLAEMDHVQAVVWPDYPFKQISFTAPSHAELVPLMEMLGYVGPSWAREGVDMFEPAHVYGFDLVKDKAEPFVEALRAM